MKCLKCKEDFQPDKIITWKDGNYHKHSNCTKCYINSVAEGHSGTTSVYHKVCLPRLTREIAIYDSLTPQEFLVSIGNLMEKTKTPMRQCWIASIPKKLASFVMTSRWNYLSNDSNMAEKVLEFLSCSGKEMKDKIRETTIYGNIAEHKGDRYIIYPWDQGSYPLDSISNYTGLEVKTQLPLTIIKR